MSPRPGGDISNSSEFATMGSGDYRAEIERRRSAASLAVEILRKHTGLVLLLVYLAVTVVARMEDVWFFRYFRINIFNYSQPEDFFTASMRHSSVWLYFLIPGLLLLAVSVLLSRRKSHSSQNLPSRSSMLAGRWNTPTLRLGLGVLLTIAIATAITSARAHRRFTRVEAGRGRHVTFARTDGVSYDEQPLVIGTMGGFFFLYYSGRKVTEIVPVENTSLMTVDLEGERSPAPASTGAQGNKPAAND